MKKKKLTIVLITTLIFCVIIGCLVSADKPLKSITVSEIEEIKVWAQPPIPHAEAVLNQAETDNIIPILQKIKKSKQEYKESEVMYGQLVIFTILMSDGSTVKITDRDIEIDGRSYQIDSKSAQAISDYANKVLKTGF